MHYLVGLVNYRYKINEYKFNFIGSTLIDKYIRVYWILCKENENKFIFIVLYLVNLITKSIFL